MCAGFASGMLSPANETDWDGIEGPLINATAYADVMNQLAGKLDVIGLSTIRLIGPDTARIDLGVGSYMPAMMAKPTLMATVDHLSFHNYDGWAGGAEAAIQASALPSRNFWMTELSLSDHAFATLEQGASAVLVWDGYDSVYNHAILAGRGSTPPNDAGNGPALLSYDTATHTLCAPQGLLRGCAYLPIRRRARSASPRSRTIRISRRSPFTSKRPVL
jgi:hypothetical protein